METHVEDLKYALSALRKEPGIDSSSIAVVSWSYAGESATLLQMRDDVDLVISLSSNVLNDWVYQEADAVSRLDPSRLKATFIIITEKIATNGTERTAPGILDSLATESYFVRFNELSHGNFNVIEGMIPGLKGIANVQRWSKSGSVAQLGYETISKYALHFLDVCLKKKAAPLDNWDYANGLPNGFVDISRHGPKLK